MEPTLSALGAQLADMLRAEVGRMRAELGLPPLLPTTAPPPAPPAPTMASTLSQPAHAPARSPPPSAKPAHALPLSAAVPTKRARHGTALATHGQLLAHQLSPTLVPRLEVPRKLDQHSAERYLEYDRYVLWTAPEYAAQLSRVVVPDEFEYLARLKAALDCRPARKALLADGLPRARYYFALARLLLPGQPARQQLFCNAAGAAHWLLKGHHERFLVPLAQRWAPHTVTPVAFSGCVRLTLAPTQSWRGCRRNAAGSLPPYFPVGQYVSGTRPAAWPAGLPLRALTMHALVALLAVCPEYVGFMQLDPAALPPPVDTLAQARRDVPHPYVCDHEGAVAVPPRQAADAVHEIHIAAIPEGAKRLFFSRYYPYAPLNTGVRACDGAAYPLLWGARYLRIVEGLRQYPTRPRQPPAFGIQIDPPPAQLLRALRWLAVRHDRTLVSFIVEAMQFLQPQVAALAHAETEPAPAPAEEEDALRALLELEEQE